MAKLSSSDKDDIRQKVADLRRDPAFQQTVDAARTPKARRESGEAVARRAKEAELKHRDTEGAMAAAYMQSPEFRRLATTTRKDYRSALTNFCRDDRFGLKPLKFFDQPGAVTELVQWRDSMSHTPRTADMHIAVVGALFSWGRSTGRTLASPIAPIKKLHRTRREEIIWDANSLAKLKAAASQEVWLVAHIASLTGLRQGDLLSLTWNEVEDKFISLRTKKRGRWALIPLTTEARAAFRAIPKRGIQVFHTSRGQPWTACGFRASFGTAKSRGGIDGLRFHDLRGTAATNFAAAGLNEDDLATIMGWSLDRVKLIIRLYVQKEKMAEGMLRRMAQLEDMR